MKKQKSQRLILGILGAVVFLVVFYQFSWKARASTLSQASAVVVATESKEGDLAAAKKAKDNEEANKAALAVVQAVLPTTADAQGVIRHLTQLAVTSSVSWENVTLGVADVAPPGGGLQSVPFTIAISGTMENIELYLANIRSADVGRIITIDGVTTSFAADPLKPDQVSASLTLRVFIYSVESATTTTSTTAASKG
jgi:Tfp pilus assembly protein PilO